MQKSELQNTSLNWLLKWDKVYFTRWLEFRNEADLKIWLAVETEIQKEYDFQMTGIMTWSMVEIDHLEHVTCAIFDKSHKRELKEDNN